MSLTYQTEEEAVDQEAEEQHQSASVRPPTPYYTYILVASIIAVAAIQFTTGLEASIYAAGFDKPAFLNRGEYWRILTGAAVHGSLAHIALNSFAFYNFGRIFEMLSNRAHLAIVFLLSAIGGGVLSVIFVPEGLSVGASGGIVGLISYLAIYAFRRRQFISAEFRKSLLVNIGFIIVFGLVLFSIIDNYGHLGGLIVGAIYGLVQIPSDAYVDPRSAGTVTEGTGLVSLGIFLAGCFFTVLIILRVI